MRRIKRIVILCLVLALSVVPTFAMSRETRAQKALNAYKHENYKAFNRYSKGLPKYCNTKRSKIPRKVYDAYTSKLSNLIIRKYNSANINEYGAGYSDYFGFANVYGSKTPELIFETGHGEADMRFMIYTYKNHRVKRIGRFWGGHSYLFVVPGEKGVYQHYGQMFYENIRHIQFKKNGKVKPKYVVKPRSVKRYGRIKYVVHLEETDLDYN